MSISSDFLSALEPTARKYLSATLQDKRCQRTTI